MKLPPEKMRVVTPDVGGGFGTKLFPYREYALAAVAAERLRQPVKWIGERTEHFLGDSHGRDNISTARLARRRQGPLPRARHRHRRRHGRVSVVLRALHSLARRRHVDRAHTTFPVAHVRLRAAYTNTVPVDAYRGAGRPEASYLIERVVDAAAHDLDIAPDALRRRNLIKPKAMPYTTPTGKVYDSGDFAGTWRARRSLPTGTASTSARRSRSAPADCAASALRPISRPAATTGPETATLTLDPDGGVTLLIGSQSTGQGHATSYAQLIAERLDLPPERVRVIQGDTDRIKTGAGTGGSSSIPVGGVSVDRATKKLAEQIKEIAADALEASASDLEIVDGAVRVAGTDRVDFVRRSRRASERHARQVTRGGRLQRRAADLSERHAYRRGRDRSGHRRNAHRAITSWSTISARRSIRCCSRARCMAARCRASARR